MVNKSHITNGEWVASKGSDGYITITTKKSFVAVCKAHDDALIMAQSKMMYGALCCINKLIKKHENDHISDTLSGNILDMDEAISSILMKCEKTNTDAIRNTQDIKDKLCL